MKGFPFQSSHPLVFDSPGTKRTDNDGNNIQYVVNAIERSGELKMYHSIGIIFPLNAMVAADSCTETELAS